jgi:hypothetical protein
MDNELAIQILLAIYINKYDADHFDYNLVDDFYAYLGYNLELYNVLPELGIYGTTDLQLKLEEVYENF